MFDHPTFYPAVLVRVLFLAAALFVIGGCGAPKNPNSMGEVAAGDPIREVFESTRPGELSSPEGATRLKLLSEAVVKAGLSDAGSALSYLIEQYGEEELGLYVARSRIRQLEDEGNVTGAIALCEGILADGSGRPVEALALDALLNMHRRTSAELFLKKCAEACSSEHERFRRIGLLARIDYFHDTGNIKQTALDTVRFWQSHPATVVSGALGPYFEGNLERAGWLVERDILSNSADPAHDARLILGVFERIGLAASIESGKIENSMQSLYMRAPAVDEILAHAQPAELSPADLAHTLLQCARLDLSRQNSSKTPEIFAKYLDAAEAGVASKLASDRAWFRTLNRSGLLALHRYLTLYGDLRSNALDAFASQRIVELSRVRETMAELHGRLHEGANGAALGTDVVALYTFFLEIDQPKASAHVLESYIEKNETDPRVPELLMKLARLQVERLDQPRSASEVYLRVFYDFPSSDVSIKAALLGSIVLVESEEHAAAYEHLQIVVDSIDRDNVNAPLANYLSGVCENALGYSEDASRRMQLILDEYPESAVGAKVLWWTASTALVSQDYEEAKAVFDELLARYPESDEAGRAKEYVGRLNDFVGAGT